MNTIPDPSGGMRYPYAALPSAPAGRWPGGQRLAIYVAVGVEDYRFDDGATEKLLPDVPEPDLVNAAWRDYGNRVGIFRLLDRLGSFDIIPTILLNTMIYDSAPTVAAAIRLTGAEIVAHGHSNSDSLAGMESVAELAYLESVATRIAVQEGVRPMGWSSPWLAHTPQTIDLLAAAGYRYLLDLRPDDQPVWLNTTSQPLLSIPYTLELNDSTTIIGRGAGAAEFSDMIVDEFDELYEAAAEQPLVMSVVVHSFISGVPFRLRTLSRALAHLRTKADVWFTTPSQIYQAHLAMAPRELPSSADLSNLV